MEIGVFYYCERISDLTIAEPRADIDRTSVGRHDSSNVEEPKSLS